MLGGFLGGLANLGTIYGGYQAAQARDQYLQQFLQQQQANQLLLGLGAKGAFDPRTTAQPSTTTTTPTPTPLQPLTTAPVTPVDRQPLLAPPSQLQTAAAGPLGPEVAGGLPGGGPFGQPGLPGQSGFGGGLPAWQQQPQIFGGNIGTGSPFGPSIGSGGPGTLPDEARSIAGYPSRGLGRQAAPLPDVGQQTSDVSNGFSRYEPPIPSGLAGLGPPPDWQGPIHVGATERPAPQLSGLGGGIVQPAGGFGLPPRYTPTPPMQGPVRPQGGTVVRGSVYGNYGDWVDPSDRAPQAGGQPVSAGPGIALPIPRDSPDFGKSYYVTAPNGQTLLLRQTDVGPGAAGRGVDINAPAAEAFGYSPQTFPTDAGFRIQPAGGGQMLTPTLAGTGVDWRDEQPQFQRAVSDLLASAPPEVRDNAVVESGFRTRQQQEEAYARYKRGEISRAARPGESRHEIGAAADWQFKTPEAERWIKQNAPRFGLSFPFGDDPGHMQMAGAAFRMAHTEMSGNLSPEQHGIGDRGLAMILARMPQIPQAFQMMKPSEVAQLIQTSFPGVSDAVKGAVFLKALPLMNDIAKEQTAQAWEGWKAQMEQLGFIQKEEDVAEQRAERRSEFQQRQEELRIYRGQMAEKGGQVWQDPQSGQSYWVVGGRVQPLEGLPSTAVRPGTAGTPAAQESVKLYERLEADKLRGDDAAVKRDQQAIDDWNRTQGKGISTRGGAVAAARAGLQKEHPDWDEGQIQDALGEFKRLQSIESGFGSGVLGRNVVSLNTVAAHAETVRRAFEDLKNGQIPRFNAIAQQIAQETGQEAPTDFAAAYSIMSGEVVRLLTTTGGTEGDRNHFQSLLQRDFSTSQGRGALNIFEEMIDARFNALEQQYSSVGSSEQQEMRKQRFRNQLLSDDARALHSRVAKAAEKVKELTTPGGTDWSSMSDEELIRRSQEQAGQ